MRRFNENDSFLPETAGRLSSPSAEIAAKDSDWIRVVRVRNGAANVVDSAPNKAGGVLGLAELWVAEINLCATAIGELAFWVELEEAPNVQVFDAVLTIKVVKRTALAQGDRKQLVTVETAGLRFALEQIGTIERRNLPKALQVCLCQWFV
ncbi:hypothetical protein D3C76_801860 [compost metagenome]